MWPNRIELDEEKSKHAVLAQQNGFGPAFFHGMLIMVNGTVQPNKYDLTAMKSVINRI
jgi:hypothetical protein